MPYAYAYYLYHIFVKCDSHKSQIYYGMVKKLITTYLLLLIGLLPACTKLKEVGNNAIRPTLRP